MKKTTWVMAKRILTVALAVVLVSTGMDCDQIWAETSTAPDTEAPSNPTITISDVTERGVNITIAYEDVSGIAKIGMMFAGRQNDIGMQLEEGTGIGRYTATDNLSSGTLYQCAVGAADKAGNNDKTPVDKDTYFQFLTVPHIDYSAETLTLSSTDIKWSLEKNSTTETLTDPKSLPTAANGKNYSLSSFQQNGSPIWDGSKAVTIYFQAPVSKVSGLIGVNYSASNMVAITIPARLAQAPAETDFRVTRPSADGSDGKLEANKSGSYQWKISESDAWTSWNGGVISGIQDKTTYYIRRAATNSTFASDAVAVTVASKDEVTISGVTVAQKVYDGNPAILSGEAVCKLKNSTNSIVTDGCGTLVYSYQQKTKREEWGEITTVAPTKVGNYRLIISVDSNNDTYTGSSEAIPFSIIPTAPVYVSMNDEENTFTVGCAQGADYTFFGYMFSVDGGNNWNGPYMVKKDKTVIINVGNRDIAVGQLMIRVCSSNMDGMVHEAGAILTNIDGQVFTASTDGGGSINGSVLIAGCTDGGGPIYGDMLIAKTQGVTGQPKYQWKANGNNIAGATNSVYKVQGSDIGKTITVEVTVEGYTDALTASAGTVKKALEAPNTPAPTKAVANNVKTVAEVPLPTGWTWAVGDKNKTLVEGKPVTAMANYTADDAGNYQNVSVSIVITRLVYKPAKLPIKVSEVTLDQTVVGLKIGKLTKLKTTITPSNATNKNVIYKSSNTKIATVTSAGEIKGMKEGTCIITVTAEDGSGKKDTVKVTVSNQTITYKLNKGKNSETNPETYLKNQTVSLKNPVRKGYTFKGWYTNRKFKSNSKITKIKKGNKKNFTIYAKWEKVSVAKAVTPKLTNPKSGQLKITYAKTGKAAGYEITYATNSKFTKGKKTISLKGISKTITKLKKGTTYYVKVRACQIDSAGAKVYGKYSSAKKIKMKK